MAAELIYQCEFCGKDCIQEVMCNLCTWVFIEEKDRNADTCPKCGDEDPLNTIYLDHAEEICEADDDKQK